MDEIFVKKNFRVHSRYENVDIRHRMGSLSDLIILACEVRWIIHNIQHQKNYSNYELHITFTDYAFHRDNVNNVKDMTLSNFFSIYIQEVSIELNLLQTFWMVWLGHVQTLFSAKYRQ